MRVLGLPQEFLFLTGDATSALLLSQLVYWTERCTSPKGCVYKRQADWEKEMVRLGGRQSASGDNHAPRNGNRAHMRQNNARSCLRQYCFHS